MVSPENSITRIRSIRWASKNLELLTLSIQSGVSWEWCLSKGQPLLKESVQTITLCRQASNASRMICLWPSRVYRKDSISTKLICFVGLLTELSCLRLGLFLKQRLILKWFFINTQRSCSSSIIMLWLCFNLGSINWVRKFLRAISS